MEEWHITTGWEFRQSDKREWMPVARVPTNVHVDLIDNQIIKDPFIGYNELDCQWIAEKSWTYRVSLGPIRTLNDSTSRKSVLAFDGLDTYATVKLNDKVILQSDNMFIEHRVDVTSEFSDDKDSSLEIEFTSALLESQRMKAAYPRHKWVGWNGDMARLAARKAQYHYGWDWGPVLNTCGPWRPVRIETYEARISHLRIEYEVDMSLDSVSGSLMADVEGTVGAVIEFAVGLGDKEVFRAKASLSEARHADIEFHVSMAKLWYPHGYGEQSLYTITATLLNGNHKVHSVSKRTGFRKAELIQDRDNYAESFYFRVNNVDVFCGGSNWIPADSFTPRITESKYRELLQAVVDSNQTMIRVWGGGIWEAGVFYDTCDELGILVWQDFMFACGNYPAYQDFLDSVENEATCQVKRLQDHPSIIIYAGNNEDYQIQEQFKLKYDYNDKKRSNWLESDFPARYIYEELLPRIVETYSSRTPYHPGSPWGDGKRTSNPRVGDLHEWNVWHGTQEKYQVFDSLGGLFNSEFGMQAFPHIETIKHFVDDSSQLYPQSEMIEFHNKAAGHERRIATYLMENFRVETDLKKFLYLTQLCQAEALMFAFQGWRRKWSASRRCGGALVWQLNDCWPVISWSIIDYFLRKKPAYYTIRRALAPVAVAVKRTHRDWSARSLHEESNRCCLCWVASRLADDIFATLEIRFVSIATGENIKKPVLKQDTLIAANGTTEIWQGYRNDVKEEPHVLTARLWIGGELVSRHVDWPQPLKYLDFGDRGLEISMKDDQITAKAAKPTKGLVFEEQDKIHLSDNCVDVIPGDEQTILVSGPDTANFDLKWTYLGAP